MSTKTKPFDSAQPGAPVLSGTAGAMISLLDAVLVNGFGLQTATSVTIAAGVCTINVATTPSAVLDSVILVAGATPAGLNGEQRVTSYTSNSVSFVTAETGTVTGTVTMKVAGAGWSKAFSGTNLAAYQIIDPTGTGMYLRVDDTGTTTARVRGYETMTDVNTGTGPFPTVAQWAAPGLWWSKSNGANTTARPWKVFVDNAGVYILPKPVAGSEAQGFYFGDVLSFRNNDGYRCTIMGYTTDQSGNGAFSGPEIAQSDPTRTYLGCYFARAPNTLGGAVPTWHCNMINMGPCDGSIAIGGSGATYPSLTDNGLMLSRIMLFTDAMFRGYFPGVYGTPQAVLLAFSSGDRVLGTGNMVGTNLVAIKFGSGASGQGCLFFDPLSDWR